MGVGRMNGEEAAASTIEGSPPRKVAKRELAGGILSQGGAMRAEISFDLVMVPTMDFVEGTYRLPGGDWQVFVFTPDMSAAEPKVTAGRWSTGANGVAVTWPRSRILDEAAVLR